MPGHSYTKDQMGALQAGEGAVYERLVRKDQRPLFQQAMRGDYSQFEHLEGDLRAFVAEQYMEKLIGKIQTQLGNTQPQLKDTQPLENSPQFFFFAAQSKDFRDRVMDTGLVDPMNPALRLGLSLQAAAFREEKDLLSADRVRDFNHMLTDLVMKRTLTPINQQQFDNLSPLYDGKPDELRDDIVQDFESKIFMSKLLMTAHMGQFSKVKDGGPAPWDHSVSTAFAHCSRVSLETPAGVQQQMMMNEALFGKNIGDAAGIAHRPAATHDVTRRSADGKQAFQEVKLAVSKGNVWRAPINQRGMDLAVGGLGSPGVPGPGGQGQLVRNDGSCGHAYIRLKEGDEKHCGAILVGLESDAPGKRNQQGHKHGAGAHGEELSSLGGARADETGDKYGGRHIDLTQLDPALMTEVLGALEQKIRRCVKDQSPQALQELESINEQLTGKPMNTLELTSFLSKLELPALRIQEIVTAAKPPQNEELRVQMQHQLTDIQAKQMTQSMIKPPDTAVYRSPPKPNSFQRFMYNHFGAFAETCGHYDSYVRSRVVSFDTLVAEQNPAAVTQPTPLTQKVKTLDTPDLQTGKSK